MSSVACVNVYIEGSREEEEAWVASATAEQPWGKYNLLFI